MKSKFAFHHRIPDLRPCCVAPLRHKRTGQAIPISLLFTLTLAMHSRQTCHWILVSEVQPTQGQTSLSLFNSSVYYKSSSELHKEHISTIQEKERRPYLFWKLRSCQRGLLSECHRSMWCLALRFCFGWCWWQQIWRLAPPHSLAHSPESRRFPLEAHSEGETKKDKWDEVKESRCKREKHRGEQTEKDKLNFPCEKCTVRHRHVAFYCVQYK